MNSVEFDKQIQEMFDNCKNTLIKKGREYQSTANLGENVFANFQRGAQNVGTNQETVLYIYLNKHIDSISTFIKDMNSGKSITEVQAALTEPLNSRIMDAINYLLLLNSMINEDLEKESKTSNDDNKHVRYSSGFCAVNPALLRKTHEEIIDNSAKKE